MKNFLNKVFNKVAKDNGYADKYELLRDYGFMPTVLIPKHKKSEFFRLLFHKKDR